MAHDDAQLMRIPYAVRPKHLSWRNGEGWNQNRHWRTLPIL